MPPKLSPDPEWASMNTTGRNPASSLEIAHVLFIDIVAYSKLHMDTQQLVLRDLQEAVRASPTFANAKAEEQLIRLPTGDGMALVFFNDPEAPARCALELAEILHKNSDLKLRMGIHTGPVYRVADINANRNVAGGGINTAQRVMDCGDAGHILLSKSSADVLAQVSSWKGELFDLGLVKVKHGERIHLFNLCVRDLGNPAIPNKLRSQSLTFGFRKFFITVSFGVTATAVLIAVLYPLFRRSSLVQLSAPSSIAKTNEESRKLEWRTQDENGNQYKIAWRVDPACRESERQDAKHLCEFVRTQRFFAGDNRPYDRWNISLEAPGPVYDVQCEPTGTNEFNEVKGNTKGHIEGNIARCSGWIDGGDAEIQMTVLYKQRW
jgi:class 3 adenylate cyclase